MAQTIREGNGAGQLAATPSPTPGGGFVLTGANANDYAKAEAGWKGTKTDVGGTSSADTAPSVVPLWRTRPEYKAPTGPNDIISTVKDNAAYKAWVDSLSSQMVPIAQATRAYLDMNEKDRQDLKKLMIDSQLLPADATDAQVMNEWAQWVQTAQDYNTGRPTQEYISPWEAITKLGVKKLAGEGAKIDTYPHPIDQTETTTQSFTLGQIQGAAEQVLMATLKRGAKPDELQRYLDAINKYAKDHPIVKHTTGTVTGPDQSNSTVTQTGGVDSNEATAMMTNLARQDPYYAETQAATTYFDAVMQALNSPINM